MSAAFDRSSALTTATTFEVSLVTAPPSPDWTEIRFVWAATSVAGTAGPDLAVRSSEPLASTRLELGEPLLGPEGFSEPVRAARGSTGGGSSEELRRGAFASR